MPEKAKENLQFVTQLSLIFLVDTSEIINTK